MTFGPEPIERAVKQRRKVIRPFRRFARSLDDIVGHYNVIVGRLAFIRWRPPIPAYSVQYYNPDKGILKITAKYNGFMQELFVKASDEQAITLENYVRDYYKPKKIYTTAS